MINGNIPGKKQREADNIQQHYLRQIFNHIFSNYLTEKRRQPYAVVAKRSFNSAPAKHSSQLRCWKSAQYGCPVAQRFAFQCAGHRPDG